MNWIIDHGLAIDDERYIVFAIGGRPDKTTYLYKPGVMKGWEFKRLLPGCYAAMPMPEWKGLPTSEENLTTLRDGVKALAEQLEQIVCVVPPDDGVVLLSNEGPVHYDAEQQCNVYDHEHFSPLGDALIAMHDKLTALLGEKGE